MFRARKAQVFSVDNLIALTLIIVILGASLQYMSEAQNKIKLSAGDYELWVVASDSADFISKHMSNRGAKTFSGPGLNCSKGMPTPAPPTPFPYGDGYVFKLVASEDGHFDQTGCSGYNVSAATNATTMSIRRFIYYHYDDGTEKGPDLENPRILGVDLLVWRRP